ncbi:hypothetical protein PAXRUDRAFT_178339 [Paxillus rubicundulus Ve08.2h10]|uniref:Unplaced genomic scaffold scaffold_4886, whole genome shotgun sequence n=1 Tax=Paxillus rubicundulus Ve08.2h10 TaxID=930991 RepID=A0A0D0CRR9_9AGAM|nr:hypothetical protein PAXRUDRAFT_178339 [Paxillus rubicundulus Ve08.2h10]
MPIQTLTDHWTSEHKQAWQVIDLAEKLHITQLPELLQWFPFLMNHPDNPQEMCDIPLTECPWYNGKIKVFNSASVTFFAPSDISRVDGMQHELICSCPVWRTKHP